MSDQTVTVPRYRFHCPSCSCEPPDTDSLAIYAPHAFYGFCEACGRTKWQTEIHAFHRGSPRRSTHCGCCTHPHDLEPGGHTIPHRDYPEAGR